MLKTIETRNLSRRTVAISAVSATLVGLFYGGISIIYASLGVKQPLALLISYLHNPAIIVLNVLPALLLCVFLWLVTNRVWAAGLFTGLAIVSMGCVNYLKLLLRGDPVIAKDIFEFSEAAKIGERYSGFLRPAVILGAVTVVAMAVLCALLFRARMTKTLPRLICATCLVGLSGALYFTVYASDSIYDKNENIDRNIWFMSRWSDTDQYVSRGFLYPLIHSIKNIADPAPEGYDEDEAAAALSAYGDSDIPDDKKVNVVAVMLEAFTDFTDFDLDIKNDPYANLHRLEAEGVSGNLITNIFAGGTVDTERAFLTGVNKLYEYREDAGSYVRYLQKQGYTVEGGHPCYGWFYNRQNVNTYLGFENYWFYETRYGQPKGDTYSGMMTDQEFYEDLLTQFDKGIQNDEPYFNFSVTYQNHGPYEADNRYFTKEYIAKTDALSETGYNIINNYLSGMAKSDAALGYLADELEGRDEPVVLVLFGDHKPWLGNGAYVYSELGIDISCSDEQSFRNYYSTPYVIWANDSAKKLLSNEFTGDGGDFSPCFLMNKVFELCSWDGPGFMKAANELKSQVEVFTQVGAYWENGVFTDALSDSAQSAMDNFLKLQYYWRKNP